MAKAKVNILNPRVYIPNFLKIRTKEAKLVPFKLNNAQEQVLSIIEDQEKKEKPIRLIVLKARQLGISTFTEAYIFNKTATQKYINSLIIAHKDDASQNLFNMYRTFYDNLPPQITPMTKYSNKKEITFQNPTQDIFQKRKSPGLESKVIVAVAKDVSTGRSNTIQYLHASEVAFWSEADILMTGLMQTIPDIPNTAIVIESTANGIGGYFYDLWQKAENGENDFIPVFLPWFVEPQYTKQFENEEERRLLIEEVEFVSLDKAGKEVHTEEYDLMKEYHLTYEQLNWRKSTIQNKLNGDIEKFKQEYPSTPEEAFIASGRPRFDMVALKLYLKNAQESMFRGYLEYEVGVPKLIVNDKGYVDIWEKPKKDMFYVIGADVAEGLAHGDYSVGVVYDDDFNLVAQWRGHIDPDLFGDELVKLAKYYNNAYLGIEVNNHGRTTIKSVIDADYMNLFYSKSYDKAADIVTKKVGWETNQKTKKLLVNTLARWIREKWVGMKSKTIIRECMSYIIEDNGSTNAQNGCFDDTVMASGIALQLHLENRGEDYVPEDTNKLEQDNLSEKPKLSFIQRMMIKKKKRDDEDGIERTL